MPKIGMRKAGRAMSTTLPPDLWKKVECQAKEEFCSFQSIMLRAVKAYFAEEAKDGSNRKEDSHLTA